MSTRRALYDLLVSYKCYLPPLTDRSLTVATLTKLFKTELVCPTSDLVKSVDIKCKAPASLIRDQILSKFEPEHDLIWFSRGRLPSKSYLIDVLYSFDPDNPVFGKKFRMSKPRCRILTANCKKCIASVKRLIRKAKRKKTDPIKRPVLAPIGIPFTTTLREMAQLLFQSKTGWLSIRRARNDEALQRFGIDELEVQYRVQREIGIIDGLIERWQNLGEQG